MSTKPTYSHEQSGANENAQLQYCYRLNKLKIYKSYVGKKLHWGKKKKADRASRQASLNFFFSPVPNDDPSESSARLQMAVVWHRFCVHRGQAVAITTCPRNIDEWYCEQCQRRRRQGEPPQRRKRGSTARYTEGASLRGPEYRREERRDGRKASKRETGELSQIAP